MMLYLRSRRMHVAIILLVVLAVLNAIGGGHVIDWMETTNVSNPFRMRYVLTGLIAAIAVGSLSTPVPDIDRGDVGPLAHARRIHLIGMLLLGLVLIEVSTIGQGIAAQVCELRGYLGWIGIALLTAAILREHYAWVGAILGTLLVSWNGLTPAGRPRIWNWVIAPPEMVSTWITVIILLLIGGASYWLLSPQHHYRALALAVIPGRAR